MNSQSGHTAAVVIKRTLRPPRAGSAGSDRRAMRAALQRALDEHRHDAARLERAGYASPEEFSTELAGLLQSTNEELSAKVLAALFAEPHGRDDGIRSGRLGRVLGLA